MISWMVGLNAQPNSYRQIGKLLTAGRGTLHKKSNVVMTDEITGNEDAGK